MFEFQFQSVKMADFTPRQRSRILTLANHCNPEMGRFRKIDSETGYGSED